MPTMNYAFAPSVQVADPRGPIESLYATGHWLLAQGRPRDAARVFRVLLLCAPTEERSWLALGTCHERLGQLQLALEMFGSGALVTAPAPRCWIAKARVFRALGYETDANTALAEAYTASQDAGDDGALALLHEERRAS